MKARDSRAKVHKTGGYWHWECRPGCPAGGTGYRDHASAYVALCRHLVAHEGFGFRASVR
jgi:hypothetical protein